MLATCCIPFAMPLANLNFSSFGKSISVLKLSTCSLLVRWWWRYSSKEPFSANLKINHKGPIKAIINCTFNQNLCLRDVKSRANLMWICQLLLAQFLQLQWQVVPNPKLCNVRACQQDCRATIAVSKFLTFNGTVYETRALIEPITERVDHLE